MINKSHSAEILKSKGADLILPSINKKTKLFKSNELMKNNKSDKSIKYTPKINDVIKS